MLVVDHDTAHTRLLRQALTRARMVNPVVGFARADRALSYLHGTGRYADRSQYRLPAVVVTAFGIDNPDGPRILDAVRTSIPLRKTPVVAIGTLADEDEVHEAHRLGATAYLARPLACRAIVQVITSLNMPWSVSETGS
ncbi:response regulator [Nocardioides sp. CGMCC 1.13656]|nr:response regulator [Nocardioides sp. CGMCC 1.13656]